MLFGIHLVGDKATMDPIISEEPGYEENELKNTGIFPAGTLTLAVEKPLEEGETLLREGTIETSDVESKDTFFWLMSTITCCLAMAISLANS